MAALTERNLARETDSFKKRLLGPAKARPKDSVPSLAYNLSSNRNVTLKATMSSTRLETTRKDNASVLSNTSRDVPTQAIISTKRPSQVCLKEKRLLDNQTHSSSQRSFLTERQGIENQSKLQDKTLKTFVKQKVIIPRPQHSRKLSPLVSPEKEVWEHVILSRNEIAAAPNAVEKGSVDYLKACAQKFMTAKRIIKAFERPGSTARKETDESMIGNMEESGVKNPLQQNFHDILQAIQMIMQNKKNKPEVEKYLEIIVEAALKTRHNELYVSALKTQAKILFIYNNIYKAIGVFKNVKNQADMNNSFTIKLKAYKYLGLCFMKIKNYQKAIFYNIKMLQAAWLCNSKRYELSAYDQIGIAYYYLGNLEKANYYHERMVSGALEPADSKLRQLGVTKLLNKMAETRQALKRNTGIKVSRIGDDEEGFVSEDEFDLPTPKHGQHSINNEFSSGYNPGRGTSPPKKRKALLILSKMVNGSKMQSRPAKTERVRTTVSTERSKDMDSFTIHRPKKDIFNGSVNSQILLSHLSPNRMLNNFHPKDTQNLMNSYLSKGSENDESLTALDIKSSEEIRKKLEKLKDKTLMGLKRIIEIEETNKNRMKALRERSGTKEMK